ncbi:MAG: tetratricopeptide repeat protein, partial [Planctomycetes bacterium]|nr:tetratricopeptide repeat protein [Planctomycetota bacterium]
AWGHLGAVCDAHSLDETAVICYRQARTLAPGDFRWTYLEAVVLEELGADLASIEAAFTRAIELRPDYVAAHVRLADALARRGVLESAQAAYRKAVRLDPELVAAHRGLGQVSLSMDDPLAAIEHFQRALKLAPDDGASRAAVAQAYHRLGQHERAEQAASQVRGSGAAPEMADPVRQTVIALGVSSTLCFQRAMRLFKQERYPEAIKDLKIVKAVHPSDLKVTLLLSTAYLRTGRIDAAISLLTTELRDRDDARVLHARLAELLMRRNRVDQAIRHFRLAVKGPGSNAAVRAMLASALARGGDLDGAIVEFERASAEGELDATGCYNWGYALRQGGNIEQAVAKFREAIRLQPRYANAHCELGVALENLGHTDEAIEHYRMATRIDPRHRAARRLQALGVPLREAPVSTPGQGPDPSVERPDERGP